MALERKLIFEAAYIGLREQGFQRSLNPSFGLSSYTACAFRGSGGMKCALGMLIPDEKYSVGLEMANVEDVFAAFDPKYGKVNGDISDDGIPDDICFLAELQAAHDCKPNPSKMKDALVQFARRFNLKIPE